MDQIAATAPEIDRLVWTVNRWAEHDHGSTLQEIAATVGLPSPGHIGHFADWLMTAGVTLEIATRRLPYAPHGKVDAWFAELAARELVAVRAGVYRATPALQPLANGLLDARTAAAHEYWMLGDDLMIDLTESADELIARVPGRFAVAQSHRSIPPFPDQRLTLHTRLVTLRYMRAHAHVEAWSAAMLSAEEIWALTALWKGGDPGPGLSGIESKGLADGRALTPEGRELRSSIEDDTNARLEPIFGALDRHRLDRFLDGLCAVQGSPP